MEKLFIKYKDEVLTILVDADRLEELSSYDWKVSRQERDNKVQFYFRARHRGGYVYLHRLAGNITGTDIANHIDGDTLNNTAANLRSTTRRGNARNKAKSQTRKLKYKGYYQSGKRFIPQINDGQDVWRAHSKATEREAAETYDRIATILFGDDARTNF